MDISDVIKETKRLKGAYHDLNRREGRKVWMSSDYLQGLMGDLGEVAQLLARRKQEGPLKETDRKLAKELCDCIYMTFSLADELDIDMTKEYPIHLEFLEQYLKEKQVEQ